MCAEARRYWAPRGMGRCCARRCAHVVCCWPARCPASAPGGGGGAGGAPRLKRGRETRRGRRGVESDAGRAKVPRLDGRRDTVFSQRSPRAVVLVRLGVTSAGGRVVCARARRQSLVVVVGESPVTLVQRRVDRPLPCEAEAGEACHVHNKICILASPVRILTRVSSGWIAWAAGEAIPPCGGGGRGWGSGHWNKQAQLWKCCAGSCRSMDAHKYIT